MRTIPLRPVHGPADNSNSTDALGGVFLNFQDRPGSSASAPTSLHPIPWIGCGPGINRAAAGYGQEPAALSAAPDSIR
jgi:hypothetical protein